MGRLFSAEKMSNEKIQGTISRVFAPLVYRMPVMRPWASRRHSGRVSRIVIPTMGPENLPFWMDFTPSLSTVLCVAGLSVLAAAIAGGLPAWHASVQARPDRRHAVVRIASDRLGHTPSPGPAVRGQRQRHDQHDSNSEAIGPRTRHQ